jgi:hypothetical protein
MVLAPAFYEYTSKLVNKLNQNVEELQERGGKRKETLM